MTLLVFMSLLLSLTPASAQTPAVSVIAGANNSVILRGPNCARLVENHRAFCQWRRGLEPEFTLSAAEERKLEASCQVLSATRAQLSVQRCLPEFARQHHSKRLFNHGPNCWGTALGLKGHTSRPRFMWSEEMHYWMDSPLCQKLPVGEAPQAGDIINVYGPEYLDDEERQKRDEGVQFWQALYPGRYQVPTKHQGNYTGFHRLLHSETYLSRDLTFGKESPNKDDRFKFHPLAEVYGRPRESEKECQENNALSPYLRERSSPPKNIRGSKCAYFTTVHRCQNFKAFFSTSSLSAQEKEVLASVEALEALQEKLFELVVKPSVKLEACEVTLLTSLAEVTMARARQALAQGPVNKIHEMLLTREYFAGAGIRKSLQFAGKLPE